MNLVEFSAILKKFAEKLEKSENLFIPEIDSNFWYIDSDEKFDLSSYPKLQVGDTKDNDSYFNNVFQSNENYDCELDIYYIVSVLEFIKRRDK